MSLKVRKESENAIAGIFYLKNRIDNDPEFAIPDFQKALNELILFEGKKIEFKLAINLFTLFADSVFELKPYEFSTPINKERFKLIGNSIKDDIQNCYLSVPHTGLKDNEKQDIVNAIDTFFDPNKSAYWFDYKIGLTRDDIKALNFIRPFINASRDFIYAIILSFAITLSKNNSIEDKLPFNLTLDVLSLIDFKDLLTNPKYNKHQILPKKLTQTYLRSYYVNIIFHDLDQLLPQLSPHRKTLLTGYFANGFGIISEEEWNPEYSSSRTLNEFYVNKLKHLIKPRTK